jgi:3-oxoacyl-(acyl-carrier-protein) synthase
MMRRVVVTGLGMVTPLGCGVEYTWRRLLAGESGIKRIEKFDVSDIPCKIAGQVIRGDGSEGTFNPDQWMEPKEQRKVDDFIIYAMSAATQALDDAGWHPVSYDEQITTGVLIGSGIGGVEGIAETALLLRDRGPRRVSPFFIPGRLINLASGYVSIKHGLKGPNHAVVTACSTGAHAIGDAGRLIALGDADVMVAGGAESPVNRISLAGFAACRALSTSFNETPERASRPYDRDRDGFVMGEGAGAVVLEEYDHAKRRGARIYAELIGYGLTGDAYHITAPAGRQLRGPYHDVVDKILDRPSARRGRRGRGDLLRAGHARPGGAADHQSRQSFGRERHRSGGAPRPQAADRRGAVEFVRLWRHQRQPRLPPFSGIVRPTTYSPYLLRSRLRCTAAIAPIYPWTGAGDASSIRAFGWTGSPSSLDHASCKHG